MKKLYCKCNCDTDTLTDLYRVYYESYCEECHSHKFFIKPCQGDLHDHLAYEFQPIQRQDWKPEIHPSIIMYEVEQLITQAFEHCGEEMPDYANLRGYPFTHIQISPSDPSKISGMSWSWFQKKVCGLDEVRVSKLDYYYKLYITDDIKIEDLIESGTYLKPGKLIRALAPGMGESKVTCIASKLADILRGKTADTSRIEVTDTPSDIYQYNTNFSSCMSGQPRHWFQLYDECPTISIAYLMDGDSLVGRALLHSNVDVNKGEYTVKLVDRIYSDDSDILAMFKEWAKQNGYHHKLNQDRGSTSMIDPEGGIVENPELSFGYNSNLEYENVPYLDTFQSYEPDEGIFNSWGSGTSLTSTDGVDGDRVITGPRYYCERCGNDIDEDDRYHSPGGEDYCERCYENNVSYCESCEDDVWSDDMCSTGDDQYVCSNCLNRYYTMCDDCGEYHQNDDIIRTEDNYDLCPECKERSYECEDCGTVLYQETTYDTEDGDKILCDDCLDGYRKCSDCGTYTDNSSILCDDCEEVLCEENN